MEKTLKYITKDNKPFQFFGLNSRSWIGIITEFIQTTLVGIFYYLSYYFVHTLKYNVSLAGLLISFYGLGAMFGGVIGGKMSDKIDLRIVNFIFLLTQSINFYLMTRFSSFSFLVINVFLLGASNYGFLTSNTITILSHCNNKLSQLRAINMLTVASNLGLGLSAIIVGFCSDSYFTQLFLFNSITLFILGVYILTIQSGSVDPTIVNQGDVTQTHRNRLANNNKIIFLVLSCVFIIGLVVSQMSSTYSLFIKDSFPLYGLIGFNAIFILNTILIVLFQAPLGEMLINKNGILLTGIGCLLFGLGMGILSISKYFGLVVFSCIVYTFGEIIFFSITQNICYETAKKNKKGIQIGMYRTTYALSRIVGPFCGGILFEHFGGETLWFICFSLGLFCFVICFINKHLYVGFSTDRNTTS